MLYVNFPEEINNVLDIQIMGKGCYRLEFTDPSLVVHSFVKDQEYIVVGCLDIVLQVQTISRKTKKHI